MTTIREAFDRGVAAGRAAAKIELDAFASFSKGIHEEAVAAVAPFVTPSKPRPVNVLKTAPKVARGVRKAAGPRTKGVKEAILRYLGHADGGTIEGIIEAFGFKENSVRGTLMALKKQGLVRQDGQIWTLTGAPGGNGGIIQTAGVPA